MLDIVRFISSHPLTRDSKRKALKRFALWQLKSRLGGEFVVPWVGGTKLALRHGMRGATGNIYAGLHEFADMLFVLHFLRPDDLFLDIGANVGSYTVLASGVRGARTWAFEPDAAAAERLRRNVEVNGIGELVRIHRIALGASERLVPFTVGRDTMNRVARAEDGGVRNVPQRRLDAVLDGRTPTMMKLDVEGYEDEVLKGAEASVSNDSLLAIEAESASAFFEKTLERHGFRRVFYEPYARALRDAPCEYPAANALFVRNEERVAERLRGASPVTIGDHEI